MNVILTPPVEIALRSLGDQDRRKVEAWIDHLKSWESDPHVRRISHKLGSAENVYMLKTTSDVRIFFRLEKDKIEVLDIANKSTVLSFSHAWEPD